MDAIRNKGRLTPAQSDAPAFTGLVCVRGAREHNLKNIDVQISRDALVVLTGMLGSGKSSLVFGMLYVKAQWRYFESVAPYTRHLIEQVDVPRVDAIEGLSPAVALQQQRGTPSARSSAGSVTMLLSLMCIFYSCTGDYPPKQPMLLAEDFSPNTVQGACPTCHGPGRVYEVTEKSMVPDDSLTIRECAIAAQPPAWRGQNLRDTPVTPGYDVGKPRRDLPKKVRDWILFTDEQPIVPVYAGLTPKETRAALKRKDEPNYQGTFSGARRYALHTFANTQNVLVKKRVSQFMVGSACPTCHGRRLKKEVLSIKFAGFDVGDFARLPPTRLAEMPESTARGKWPEPGAAHSVKDAARGSMLSRSTMRDAVEKRVVVGGPAYKASPDVRCTLNPSEEKYVTAQRIAAELLERLTTLADLSLGYLVLERSMPMLSSGETQHPRLATQLSSQLSSVVYVLDEPSVGLHPTDSEALLSALQGLEVAGNSPFVVEHDLQMVRRADQLVDVGPAANEADGYVVYSGPPAGPAKVEASQTRRYLFVPPAPAECMPRKPIGWLRLADTTHNNLLGLNAAFPLGCLTVVTGVPGSGKSSLVSQALPELIASHLGRASESPDNSEQDPLFTATAVPIGGCITEGMDIVWRLARVDQKSIGRTPRSNLITYMGLFDHVRKLFADMPLACKHRYSAGCFSFNVAQGRCLTCEGEGFVSVELLFLPSVYVPRSICHGTCYNAQALEVTWRDKNIAEALHLTVDAACDFLAGEASMMRVSNVLRDIGLGYLWLDQPATELPGGEAQRTKLATEL